MKKKLENAVEEFEKSELSIDNLKDVAGGVASSAKAKKPPKIEPAVRPPKIEPAVKPPKIEPAVRPPKIDSSMRPPKIDAGIIQKNIDDVLDE